MRQLKRKEFLFFLPALIGTMALWLWKRAVDRDVQLHQRFKRIYYDLSMGPVVRNEEVIFIRNNESLLAFDGRCTHLGCKLNLIADGKIVCPCHGSEFSSEGKVMKGPAVKDLYKLPVKWDSDKKKYYTEILLNV